MPQHPQEHYQQRLLSLQQAHKELAAKNLWMPWTRAFFFLLAGILLALSWSSELGGWGLPLATLSFGLFFLFVRIHRRLQHDLEDNLALQYINEQALLRLQGLWQSFPRKGERYLHLSHPYAGDLDLFGQGSLFQQINTCSTRFGEDLLASWLLKQASLPEIQERQKLIQELSPNPDFQQDMQKTRIHLEKAETVDPSSFLDWAEARPLLAPKKILVAYSFLSPFLAVSSLIAWIWIPWMSWIWAPLLALQLFVFLRSSNWVLPLFQQVSAREKVFSLYEQLFSRVHKENKKEHFSNYCNNRFQGTLQPHLAMKRLRFWIELTDIRYSPMIHLPINILLLWDLHCLQSLERWQTYAGSLARKWLQGLGEIESLLCLSTLAFEHPDYVFPSFCEQESALLLEAKHLGHPLLTAEKRICNDVSLNQEKSLMLLTGSNMSGKSTFLRTLGLNSALAFSGSVVCAHSFECSLYQMATSLRIQDSLESGLSHFMAELQRIKMILDLVETNQPVLFLLDEILHGTNTIERRKAALSVMKHLLSKKGMGVISTHDSDLAKETQRFGNRVFFTYFSDQIENQQMIFDYHLREGVCPTSNALKLMAIVGIPIPEEMLDFEVFKD